MNLLVCDLTQALLWVVNIYTILLFVYAIASWFPDLRRGRWIYYLASIIEPVLIPIRRVVPPVAGLDLAFLILFFALQLLIRPALGHLVFDSCIPVF
ncbi:MAG TPA: YggT family protein [Candidatus Cybelea sp.]|nr:YggT family protein [Candidatus Cybelea sp.]